MARILIVEDEVLIAMLLEDIVTDLGHDPIGPMMRLLGQGRAAVPQSPGNVFEPTPDKEAVHGRWPHIWG